MLWCMLTFLQLLTSIFVKELSLFRFNYRVSSITAAIQYNLSIEFSSLTTHPHGIDATWYEFMTYIC